MPRLIPQPYQKLIRVFRKDGFSISRETDNHVVMNKARISRPVIIPKYNEVGLDIITSNLRTAKMDKEKYFKFLSDS